MTTVKVYSSSSINKYTNEMDMPLYMMSNIYDKYREPIIMAEHIGDNYFDIIYLDIDNINNFRFGIDLCSESFMVVHKGTGIDITNMDKGECERLIQLIKDTNTESVDAALEELRIVFDRIYNNISNAGTI